MIPIDFAYARPASVHEALGLLGTAGVIPLAGGQSLVPLLANREVTATLLVDISRLADLRRIIVAPDHVSIGGAATLASVMNAEVAAACPLLVTVLRSVGSTAIRNRGTLVGNLVSASPNSELPVAIVALGASLIMRNQTGERALDAQHFFLGPHRSAVEVGELVTEVRTPLNPTGLTIGGFAEVAARAGAPPLCSVAVCLRFGAEDLVEEARIVAGGITGVPARCQEHEAAIVGHPVAEITTRLGRAVTSLQPSHDLPHAAYALDVLRVMIRRAAAQALLHLHPSRGTGEPSA